MRNINKLEKLAKDFYLRSNGMGWFRTPVFIDIKIINQISNDINASAPMHNETDERGSKVKKPDYRARLGYLVDAPQDKDGNHEPVVMIGFSKYYKPQKKEESQNEFEERREKERLDLAKTLMHAVSSKASGWTVSIDYVNYNELIDTAPTPGIGQLFPFIIYKFNK